MDLTRTTDVNYESLWHHRYWTNNGSGETPYPITGESSTLQDSVTYSPYQLPGWRGMIARGESATTSLTGVKHNYNPGSVAFGWSDHFKDPNYPDDPEAFDDWIVFGGAGHLLDEPSDVGASESNADNIALSQIGNAISRAVTQIQGGVAAGELSQTLRMIRSPAKALFEGVFDYLGSLKKRTRGTKPRSKQRQAVVSNTWLEYSFGWRPLVNDIRGAADAVSNIVTYRMPRKVVSGKGTDEAISEPSQYESGGYGPVIIRHNKWKKSRAEVRYVACVKLNTDPVGGALESLGLSLPNFLPTLWELIPYSFLVDYFTNIGSIINGMSIQHTQVAWANRTSRMTNSSYNSFSFRANGQVSPGHSGGMSVGNVRAPIKEKVTVVRSPYNGGYTPGLVLKAPGLGLKWLNLGALLLTHKSAIRDLNY